MQLSVLLPFRIFAEHRDVSRIVAETREGSVGFLPRRLDCAAALVPGILAFDTPEAGTSYIAVDQGVLVKTGADVRVSVRRAIAGNALEDLQRAVIREFLTIDARESEVRAALSRMEAALLGKMAEYRRGRG